MYKRQGKALDGLGMLVEQAAESFYLWRNVRPETSQVIAALRLAKNVFEAGPEVNEEPGYSLINSKLA